MASRAGILAGWLKSEVYLGGHPNIFVLDLSGDLAEDDPTSLGCNMLRPGYQERLDSHPNGHANETVGSLFVDFVVEVAQRYRSIHRAGGSSSWRKDQSYHSSDGCEPTVRVLPKLAKYSCA